MKKISLVVIFLILGLLVIFKFRNLSPKVVLNQKITIVVTPYGSKNSENKWQGEVAPFMNQLEKTKVIDNKKLVCEQVYSGLIYNQSIVVVVSGIGKVKTGVCVASLLNEYKGQVKEVILSGTAGISPDSGARIGDICINSKAVDFDMQHYTADQVGMGNPNPIFWTNTPVLNPAHDHITGWSLDKKLTEAALLVKWQTQPEELQKIIKQYHSDTRSVSVFGPDNCIEVSGDLFWHDSRADIRARRLAAETLKKNEADITVMTSMESDTVSNVVYWLNNANDTQVEFAYVRAASNFDHLPTNTLGIPSMAAGVNTGSGITFDSAEFASNMAAKPVLKLFEIRNSK